MWVVRVYNSDDELVAEHELAGVTQSELARALGFMPSAYASTSLDRPALQNLDAAFPGRLGDKSWNGGREYFLDDDAGSLHERREVDSRVAAGGRLH
jgi:hypothetical protein